MMQIYKTGLTIFCITCLCISGCATVNTISNAKPVSPKIFSGTRLDLNAIAGNKVAMRKFNTKPPAYPLSDLPASFLADLFISPVTSGAELYEIIFE